MKRWEFLNVLKNLSIALVELISLRILFRVLFGVAVASALVEGGEVIMGGASISSPDNQTVEVTQTTDKAIVEWSRFNIGANERVRFLQPSALAIILNRINPRHGGSSIYGQLTANGQVWLINPAGIYFGPSAIVNVGSLMATTADISNSDFMAGNFHFIQSPDWHGAVINEGVITVADRGLVVLVAPGVENRGIIQANLGKIVLASGNEFTVDFYGDELISFGLNSQVTQKAKDQNGNDLNDSVSNSGTIMAKGGTVLITANAANDIVENAVNMSGRIEAKSARMQNGVVILSGGQGTVRVSGRINASGKHRGQTGGTVKILGKQVELVGNAKINVSGASGGGRVLIGGNLQGAGPEQNAEFTYVGSGVNILADALKEGNGGNVVVWANDSTYFYGNIFARGGSQAGDGGLVETSGKNYLEAMGTVNASAPQGEPGTWLLDPANIIISTATTFNGSFNSGNPNTFTTTGNDAIANVNTIINSLNAGTNVTILTTPSGTQNGDITLNSAILKTAGGVRTLTLTASNTGTITINQPISSTSGTLSVILNGALNIILNASITTLGGTFTAATVAATSAITQIAGAIITAAGNINLTVPTTSSGGIGSAGTPIATTSTGTMTLTTGAAGAFINNTGSFTLANPTLNANSPLTVTSSGVLTLPNFAFSTGTGSLNFSSLGGALATRNTMGTSSGQINLFATGLLTIAGGDNLTTTGGAITLTGTGITQANAVVVNAGSNNITANAGTGTLTLGSNSRFLSTGAISVTANAIALNTGGTPSQIGGTGAAAGLASSVLIQPFTAGTVVNIGTGTPGLALSQLETNDIRATNVQIGNSNAGLMTITAWTPVANFASNGLITLLSGSGGITQSGAINLATSLSSLSATTAGLLSSNAITTTNKAVSLTGVGVTQAAATNITTGTGNITINSGTGTLTLNATSLLLSGNAGGTAGLITLTGDTMAFNATSQIGGTASNTGSVQAAIIQPSTAGRSMGVAGGVGSLALPVASLNRVRASQVILGNSTAGAITIGTASSTWTPSATFAASLLTLDTASTISQTASAPINLGTRGLIIRDASSTLLTNTSNQFSSLAANTTGSISLVSAATTPITVASLTDASGTVSGVTAAAGVTLQATNASSSIVLNAPITANAAGNDIVLAAPLFTNNAGVSALNPGVGRYLVWSSNPASNTLGGLVYNFIQYNAVYNVSTVLGTGSGFLYTLAPIIVPSLTGTVVKNYTGTNEATLAAGNYSFTGAVNSDVVTLNNPSAGTYASTDVGTNINVAVSGLDIASATHGSATVYGYQIAPTSVNANIGQILQAPLTISANNASKTYGQTLSFSGTEFTSAGLQNGQTVGSVTLTSGGAINTANVVGSPYSIVASAATGGTFNPANYSITYSNGQLTVNPAPLAITANSSSKTYGQTVTFSGSEFSSAGLVLGQTVGSVTLNSSGAVNIADVVGSPYSIVASAATGGTFNPANYSISYTNGQLTVNPAALTITANNATKTYGQTVTFAGTEFTPTGLQNGQTVGSVSLTSGGAVNTADVVGSPYSIVASAATGGTFNPANYTISYTNGQLTVNPAGLTITANSTSKTYGQTVSFTGSEFTSAGLQLGQTVGSVTLNSSGAINTADVVGSPYSIVASSATGGTFNPANYSISYTNGQLTVNPAGLTITANNASKSYGQTVTFAGTEFSSAGLVLGQTVGSVTLNSSGAVNTADVVGSPYSIVASAATGGTFNPANYSISYTNGQLTVNPAALTITANNATKSYGQTVTFAGTEFTPTGLQNGQTVGSVTLNSSGAINTADVVGSPYSIVASAATGGTFNPANYTISYTNGQLTVNPAALTITANDASKTYGQTLTFAGSEFTPSGLQNGQTVGSVTLTSGGAVNTADVVGSPYSIVASAATGGTFNPANYTISYTSGQLTVAPATLVYTANAASRDYGAANPALTGTVSGFVLGQTEASATTGTMVFTTEALSTSLAGSYAISGGGLSANNGNYTFTQAASNATALTINPIINPSVANINETIAIMLSPYLSNISPYLNNMGSANNLSITIVRPSISRANAAAYVATPETASGMRPSLVTMAIPLYSSVLRDILSDEYIRGLKERMVSDVRSQPLMVSVSGSWLATLDRKSLDTIEMALAFIFLAMIVVWEIKKLLINKARKTINQLAQTLSVANDMNYLGRSGHREDIIDIINSRDVEKLLIARLPPSYTILAVSVSRDTSVVCILKGPYSTSAVFTATGIRAYRRETYKESSLG